MTPPNYSVTGESTLGTLVIGGEPLNVELGKPYQVRHGHPTILLYSSENSESRS